MRVAIDVLERERCSGCGICFAICPQDVFRMDDKARKAVIAFPGDCVACWSCELFCPTKCIKVSEPRPMKMPPSY
ncbi:MAG: ferredoxin family protein [Proteobacteria bacterium]|nr:ferredoxin family protein [Pseudomonadota bacterium]